MMKTVTLYRPVGMKELRLICESGYKEFPPRLEWQPIFYPVLNQAYAEQIALEWNTGDAFSGYCGIVTRFAIHEAHFLKYAVQNVGDGMHNELWVPAEELISFNQNIVGSIEVINAFFGPQYTQPDDLVLQNVLSKFYTNEI
jgi:hypothetical protein